ncbi:hypothetical protein SYNTR_1160 [Candidatus Syntrophocurvum alkaliphilum]|uniref:Uncharacterized protein n=1 Tax=Candidatus Syntrophocurvum alkaliphilum TaxID=2293317 RepID=A0A6I6DHJ7_9FIRM|nr:hypothetical protein SYNTR_1160 [Candidatus Syntrophocurvum alkaliphilum]
MLPLILFLKHRIMDFITVNTNKKNGGKNMEIGVRNSLRGKI